MTTRRPLPYYSLTQVRSMVRSGRLLVSNRVLTSAMQDFGWEYDDIVDALDGLRRKDFVKSAPHKYEPGTVVDYYKARKIKGVNVYMHFHAGYEGTECYLVLGSCKELEE